MSSEQDQQDFKQEDQVLPVEQDEQVQQQQEEEDDVLGWGGPDDENEEESAEGAYNNNSNGGDNNNNNTTTDDDAASPNRLDGENTNNNNNQDASEPNNTNTDNSINTNAEKDEDSPYFYDEQSMIDFLRVVATAFSSTPKMSQEELYDKIAATAGFGDLEKKDEIKQRVKLLLHNQIIMIDPITVNNLHQKLILSPGAARCLLATTIPAILTPKERRIVLMGTILKVLIQDQFLSNSNKTRLSMPRDELLQTLHKLNPFGDENREELEATFVLLERDLHISSFETFSTRNSIFGTGLASHYPVSTRGHACALPLDSINSKKDEEFSKIKEANVGCIKEIVVNPWQKAAFNFAPNVNSVASKSTLLLNTRTRYLCSLLQTCPSSNGVFDFFNNSNNSEETVQLVDLYYDLLRRCTDPDVTDPATILLYTKEEEIDADGFSKFPKPTPLNAAQTESLETLFADISKICSSELMPQRDCLRKLEQLGWSRNGYGLLLPHLFQQERVLRFKSSFGFTTWIGVAGKFKFPSNNNHALRDVQCAASGISLWIACRRICAMSAVLPSFELNLCVTEQGWFNGLIRDALTLENSRRRFVFPTMTRGGTVYPVAGDDEKGEVWVAPTEDSKSLFERGFLNDPSSSALQRQQLMQLHGDAAAASSSSAVATTSQPAAAPVTITGGIGKPPTTAAEKLKLYLDYTKATLPPKVARFWESADKVLPPNGEPMDKSLFAERLNSLGWVNGEDKITMKKHLEAKHIIGACKHPGSASGNGIFLFKIIPGRNQPPEGFNRIGEDPHALVDSLMHRLPPQVAHTGVFQINSASSLSASQNQQQSSVSPSAIGGVVMIGRMNVYSPEFAPYLQQYFRLTEQKFPPKLQKFWRDMSQVLPVNGDPVQKNVVSDALNQVYGWKENSDHITCKQNLEDAFMIGAAKAAGSSSGSGIFLYRIVPGLRQPGPGLNRISRDPETVPPMVERILRPAAPMALSMMSSLSPSSNNNNNSANGGLFNRVIDVSNLRLSNSEFKCFNQLQEVFLSSTPDGRSSMHHDEVMAQLRGKYEWRDSGFLHRAFDRYFSVGILVREPNNFIRIATDQSQIYQPPRPQEYHGVGGNNNNNMSMNSNNGYPSQQQSSSYPPPPPVFYQNGNHNNNIITEVSTVDISTPALTPGHLFKPLVDASPKSHSLSLAQKIVMLETLVALSSASIAEGANMQFLSVRKSLINVRLLVYPMLKTNADRETVFNSLVTRGFLKIYFPAADGTGSIAIQSIEYQIAQGRNPNDLRVALHDDFVRSVLAATNGNYSLLVTPTRAVLAQYDSAANSNNNNNSNSAAVAAANEGGRRRSRSPPKYPQQQQQQQQSSSLPPPQHQNVLYDAQGRAFVIGPNNQVIPLQQQPPPVQPQQQQQQQQMYYSPSVQQQQQQPTVKRVFLGPPNGSCITVPPPMLVRNGQWVQRPISSRLLLPPPPFHPVTQ